MKTKFIVSLLPLLTWSCLESPVHYKENSFPISEKNIEPICQELENKFPTYTCDEYFQKTFHYKIEEENLSIEFNPSKITLIYQTEERKNEDVYESYEDLVKALKETFLE